MFCMHHDFARNWELQFPFSCEAPNHIFVLAQTCPNSDVTKVMDHNRSHSKCHLQPHKHFLQMTCNCGTPLIHISHAQNGYITSRLLHQSFKFFAFLIKLSWESYSRIGQPFDGKDPIDITYEKSQVYSLTMLRNQYTLKSTSTIK